MRSVRSGLVAARNDRLVSACRVATVIAFRHEHPMNKQSKLVRTASLFGSRSTLALFVLAVLAAYGCGTTRITDTRRTATEQLLITDAIDKALDEIDVSPLAGKKIYCEDDSYRPSEDQRYLAATVRQKLLAGGAVLANSKSDADLVVEIRAGVVGTDSHSLVYGIPSVNVPPALAALGGPGAAIPTIPEVPFVKKNGQKGVAKIALFAFEQETGKAFWQSGATPTESDSQDVWIFGAGPFQWGSIHEEPQFAGESLPLDVARRLSLNDEGELAVRDASVNQPLVFNSAPSTFHGDKVMLAAHEEEDAEPEPSPVVQQAAAATSAAEKPVEVAEKPAEGEPAVNPPAEPKKLDAETTADATPIGK